MRIKSNTKIDITINEHMEVPECITSFDFAFFFKLGMGFIGLPTVGVLFHDFYKNKSPSCCLSGVFRILIKFR